MVKNAFKNRREFLQSAAAVTACGLLDTERKFGLIASETTSKAAAGAAESTVRPNMTGAYGPWLADTVLGEKPGALSFRTGRWNDVAEWRKVSRKRAWECIAPVSLGGVPEVRVDAKRE